MNYIFLLFSKEVIKVTQLITKIKTFSEKQLTFEYYLHISYVDGFESKLFRPEMIKDIFHVTQSCVVNVIILFKSIKKSTHG